MQALGHLKVLDLTRAGPGPFCTMVLGDLGAEVVRVEAAGVGDRQSGSFRSPDGEEAAYHPLHRNKKSIAVNLKDEAGRQIFLKLAEKADVIVEGFRPGVAKRLGIDYPTVSSLNPAIIYCSISGYGQDGPYAALAGHDINYISIGGALDLIGEAGRPPVIPLNIVADFGGAGKDAVIGILSALVVREKTGRGQFIDISLTDSVVSLLSLYTWGYFHQNVVPRRQKSWVTGGYPYYNVYETRDGGYITIGCVEPWLWENFCRAIGKEEFIPFRCEPAHFVYPPPDEKWRKVQDSLKEIFLTRTRDEWFDFLSRQDVPVGKVYSMDEVFADPQLLHRQMVVEVDHPDFGKVKLVGISVKLTETPGSIRSVAPVTGENTREVLSAMGYDNRTIDNLRREGIIGYPD